MDDLEIPEIPEFLRRKNPSNSTLSSITNKQRQWVMPTIPERKTLRPMERDNIALDITKAVGEGYFTFQKIRKKFADKYNEKQLCSGIRRAMNMKWLRLEGRTYIKK